MSDDTPDFQLKQRNHAEQIRTERTVMRMTGKSRSEIRMLISGLTDFSNRIVTQRAAAPIVQSTGPRITQVESKLGGAGFSTPTQQKPVTQTAASFPCVVVNNGVATNANLNGTLGDVVS